LIGDIAPSASATPPTLKIYGAGIVSSSGESEYSLRDATPQRIAFDIDTVLRTPYRIDSFQRNYFVVRDFAQLYEAVSENATDFAARCAKVIAESDALN
jgi:phenylalanine-4-hydroxylase